MQGFNRIPAIQDIEDPQRRKEVVEWLSDRWDLNIFQPNNYAKDERNVVQGWLRQAPPVPYGTGVEWYAEKDIYVVISSCPVGDQSSPTPEATCVPLYISVHETGIEPLESHTYQDWEKAFYEKVERGEIDISRRDPDSHSTTSLRLYEGLQPGLYSRVWSQSRYQQPLATMVAEETPEDWLAE